MDAEDLYDEIKAFLRYVGLSFGKMREVQVHFADNKLHLSHKGTHVIIDPENRT